MYGGPPLKPKRMIAVTTEIAYETRAVVTAGSPVAAMKAKTSERSARTHIPICDRRS